MEYTTSFTGVRDGCSYYLQLSITQHGNLMDVEMKITKF